MHLPEIDKYAERKSIFHSWEPRIKLVSLSFLIFSIVLNSNLTIAFFFFLLVIFLVFLSNIPFSFILIHLRWVLLFCLFFFIIMPLTFPGDKIIKLNFIHISLEGIKYASLITLRAISAILLIFPMIGTMKFDTTIKTLQKLKIPNKFIQMIIFTYRYIFVFIEETRKMFIAANARGFKKRTNIYTLKIIGNLIGMLFIRSFERTENIYNCMVSRGYTGYLKILDDDSKVCRKDFFKAFFIVIVAIILTIVGGTL